MKKIIAFLSLISTALLGCNAPGNTLSYNDENCLKTKFSQNQVINLPDFSLEYTGQTEQNRDLKLAPLHHFKIRKNTEEKTVKWSSGTGALGPVFFSMSDQIYALELRFSDKLGKLSDNEVAICKIDGQKYGLDLNSPHVQ